MDSSVATPYHRVNKILLSIIGQWPHQSTLSKRICYVIIFFFTSTHGYLQTAGMIAAFSDIDVFLEALPTVLADVVCGMKMFNFSINASMMKELVVAIEKDWKTYSSGPENEILNEYAKFGRKVTIYYAGALYGSMIPMMMVPLTPIVLDIVAPMNESYPKHLMFQQIEFLFDFERFFYPLLIHGYLGTFTYLTIIIAIDTMFMVYIQHACAKFAILGFAHIIEDANYVSLVGVIGINMLMMTASMLVAAFKMDNPDVAMKFVAFTVGEMFHLFYSSWQGELLLEHSADIFFKSYQMRWNDTSVRSQQLMIPLLLRSSIPCKLTAGKIYVLSLKSFSTVVKTSFSYMTVFTSMRA